MRTLHFRPSGKGAAGSFLAKEDQTRLRRRRNTSGDLPISGPLVVDHMALPGQSEVQSEILAAIRGVKSEMHELRALLASRAQLTPASPLDG